MAATGLALESPDCTLRADPFINIPHRPRKKMSGPSVIVVHQPKILAEFNFTDKLHGLQLDWDMDWDEVAHSTLYSPGGEGLGESPPCQRFYHDLRMDVSERLSDWEDEEDRCPHSEFDQCSCSNKPHSRETFHKLFTSPFSGMASSLTLEDSLSQCVSDVEFGSDGEMENPPPTTTHKPTTSTKSYQQRRRQKMERKKQLMHSGKHYFLCFSLFYSYTDMAETSIQTKLVGKKLQ